MNFVIFMFISTKINQSVNKKNRENYLNILKWIREKNNKNLFTNKFYYLYWKFVKNFKNAIKTHYAFMFENANYNDFDVFLLFSHSFFLFCLQAVNKFCGFHWTFCTSLIKQKPPGGEWTNVCCIEIGIPCHQPFTTFFFTPLAMS